MVNKLVPVLPDHFLLGMVRRILLGTIVGALAAFAWAYVSWSAVRLYDWALEPLPADSALVDAIRVAARKGENVMPSLVEGALNKCTLGEMVQAMADVFGRYSGGPEW